MRDLLRGYVDEAGITEIGSAWMDPERRRWGVGVGLKFFDDMFRGFDCMQSDIDVVEISMREEDLEFLQGSTFSHFTKSLTSALFLFVSQHSRLILSPRRNRRSVLGEHTIIIIYNKHRGMPRQPRKGSSRSLQKTVTVDLAARLKEQHSHNVYYTKK